MDDYTFEKYGNWNDIEVKGDFDDENTLVTEQVAHPVLRWNELILGSSDSDEEIVLDDEDLISTI